VATRRWDTKAPSTLKRNTPGRWPIEQPHTCPPQGVHSTWPSYWLALWAGPWGLGVGWPLLLAAPSPLNPAKLPDLELPISTTLASRVLINAQIAAPLAMFHLHRFAQK